MKMRYQYCIDVDAYIFEFFYRGKMAKFAMSPGQVFSRPELAIIKQGVALHLGCSVSTVRRYWNPFWWEWQFKYRGEGKR